MLASTIQFPNNNPITPTTHTTPTPKEVDEPVRSLGHARETKNNKTNHTKPPKRNLIRPGLLFQDPTVCQKTTHPPNTHPFQPPKGAY